MIDEDGGEVEGGLSSLCFESIDDDGVVFVEVAFDDFDGARWGRKYQHLMAMMNSLTIS